MARTRNRGATRRYPPLTGALVAILLAVFVLPSALNVPQSNPTQTLEFAPIPPEDDQPPPPQTSNLDRLSLGSTSTAPRAAAPGRETGAGPPAPPPVPDGAGTVPITKRCVGDPPRQTENPISPPCVGYFDGDNGGATYPGVTADEIRILVYQDGGSTDGVTARGAEPRPDGTMWDLWDPPSDEEHFTVRQFRALQAYFNDRFQTYGRSAHFFVYYAEGEGNSTPEDRRADAAALLDDVGPFAVMTYAVGNAEPFMETMAQHGVLNFASLRSKPADFFRSYPSLFWSYLPSIEQQAANFASYVCTQVLPYPVSSSPQFQGQERVLGLLHSADVDTPAPGEFAEVAAGLIEECGGQFVATGDYPTANTVYDSPANNGSNEVAATENMAAFQQADVTTVIWPQGFETKHSQAAGRQRYYPEWIIAGDVQHEGRNTASMQDQEVWNEKAWVVTTLPFQRPGDTDHCQRAMREGDPQMPGTDLDYGCGLRPFYQDTFQVFTAIQVAGPELTPSSIDRGMHAIPAIASTAPNVPACFYEPGDYTCIKDAAVGWWDRDAEPEAGIPGCWRMAEGGTRHFSGEWPQHDILASRDPETDPCHTFGGGFAG